MDNLNNVTANDVLTHAANQAVNDKATEMQAGGQQLLGTTGQEPKESNQALGNMDEFEKKLSLLTKKEKEFYLKEKKLKEFEEKIKRYEELERLKSSDPIAFLKEAGVDAEMLLKRFAEVGGKTIDDKVAELEARYKELDAMIKQKEEEAKRLQVQEQIENFRKKIVDTVKSNAERWEFVTNQEAYDLVFDVIDRHFAQTQEQTGEGELLPIEKAADMVERYLEERVKKIVTAKKLKSYLPQEEKKEEPKMGLTSLTSSMPSGSLKSVQGQPKLLPHDEAIRQIVLQLKNN